MSKGVNEMQMFGNARAALAMTIRPLLQSTPSPPANIDHFESLVEARQALHRLALERMREGGETFLSVTLRSSFERWCRAFDAFCSSNYRFLQATAADRKALALLRLQKSYFELELHNMSSQLNPLEPLAVDLQYSRLCNDMVGYAEQSVQPEERKKDAQQHRRFKFYIDTGVGPALFAVILHCRDFSIRRRAISLLQSYAAQEGMWNTSLVAKAAAGMLAQEESGFAKTLQMEVPMQASVPRVSISVDEEQKQISIQYEQGHRYWQRIVDLCNIEVENT